MYIINGIVIKTNLWYNTGLYSFIKKRSLKSHPCIGVHLLFIKY